MGARRSEKGETGTVPGKEEDLLDAVERGDAALACAAVDPQNPGPANAAADHPALENCGARGRVADSEFDLNTGYERFPLG